MADSKLMLSTRGKKFTLMLLALRTEIKPEELDKLKFLLSLEKFISESDADEIKTTDNLLTKLKHKNILNESNIDDLLKICEDADMEGTAEILRDYRKTIDLKESPCSSQAEHVQRSYKRLKVEGPPRASFTLPPRCSLESTNPIHALDTQSKPTTSRYPEYHKAKAIFANSITKGEIQSLLLQFRGIKRAQMDNIIYGHQLLDALEVCGYISESNFEPLVVALRESGLPALAEPFLQTVPVDSSSKAPLERVIKLLKLWYKSLVSRLAIAPWLEEMHLDQFYVRLSIAHTRRRAFNRRTLDSFLGILELGGYRTVIIGDAGIGKSTLSLKVVNDWEKGKTELSKFRMILFLRIRHISSKSTSFVEAIAASLPSSEAIDPEVIEKFLKEYPEKALILLDGFDELSDHLLNTPLHFDLLAIIKREKFSEVMLYLTSRSSAMAKLNSKRKTWDHFFDNILHIEGFSKETAEAFVAKWFGDSNVGSHLLANLRDNGLLDHAGTHPLLLTLFCSLVQVNLDMNLSSIPPTVTGLFGNVMTSYDFHLTKKIKEVEEKYVPYLQAVLDEKHDTLLRLGEIAWKSLLAGGVLYWTLEAFRKQCSVKVLEHALNLGILKLDSNQLTPQNRSYISLKDMMKGGEDTVAFPHKLYQEFLAGYYLAHGKSDDIIKSLQMLKQNTHKIESLECPLRFACGLNPSLALRVMEVAVTSSYMLMIQCLHECCKGNGAPEDLNASSLQKLLCSTSSTSLNVERNIEEKPVLTMFRAATQIKIPLRLWLRCDGRTPGYVRDVLGEGAPMLTGLYIWHTGVSAFSMLPAGTGPFPHLTSLWVWECDLAEGPADSSAVWEDLLHCCLKYAPRLEQIWFSYCKNVPDIVRESNATLRGLLRSRQDVRVSVDFDFRILDRTTFCWRDIPESSSEEDDEYSSCTDEDDEYSFCTDEDEDRV